MARWNYCGDINLREGGFFWRMDNPNDDFAEVVEIIPESAIGGPDNVFMIHIGSVYFNKSHRQRALDCIGYIGDEEPDMATVVNAHIAYGGMDVSFYDAIQIGPVDKHSQNETTCNPEKIRGNWKLENYVKKYYLQ